MNGSLRNPHGNLLSISPWSAGSYSPVWSSHLRRYASRTWLLSGLSAWFKVTTSRRIYRYLNRVPWRDHIKRCLRTWIDEQLRITGANGLVLCPHLHPKYAGLSVSVLELYFHLEDIPCVQFIKEGNRGFSNVNAELELESNPEERSRDLKEESRTWRASFDGAANNYIFMSEVAEHSPASQSCRLHNKRKANGEDSVPLECSFSSTDTDASISQ